MSYLGKPFLHDVFVSYAHADVDQVGKSEIKEWCQKFANDIRSKLLSFLEFKDISFYLDESERSGERLSETSEITQELKQAVSKSAILLAMMSPWYLKSDWCSKERDWWHEGTDSQTSALMKNIGRAFIAKLMETDTASWPEIFKDKEGVSKKGFLLFHRAESEFKRVPLGSIGTEEDIAAYKSLLVDIVGEMASTLVDIRDCLEIERKRQADNRLLEEDGQVLYLHARSELADQFDKAGGDLRAAGYAVGPEQPSPLSPDGRLNDIQKNYLASSDAVMILGGDDQRLGQDIIVVGRNNRRLAQVILKKRLPCAVFDVIGTRKHPASRIDNARNLNITWIDATKANWKNQIRGWLQQSINREG